MIETLTINEATERLRAAGLKVGSDTLSDGIEQDAYPFGICIHGDGRRVFQIFKKLLDEWIEERSVSA